MYNNKNESLGLILDVEVIFRLDTVQELCDGISLYFVKTVYSKLVTSDIFKKGLLYDRYILLVA